MGEKPRWLGNRGTVDEELFFQDFLKENPMIYMGGKFVMRDGVVEDDRTVLWLVMRQLRPWVTSNVAQKAESILRMLRINLFLVDRRPPDDRIFLENGTYYLDGSFVEEKPLERNRLPIRYNPRAPQPRRWLRFLLDMLEPEDILTLQEYLGYCLIPTTRAQKMLMIIGRGGEGKSHIGYVMDSIFGPSLCNGSIQKVENNRFARADLEGRLLMVDDDLDLAALNKTNYLKSIITARSKLDVERKGQQSYQTLLYVRFLCFGNGALTSLHDRSDGFFRRQIILTTREIPPDRGHTAFLEEELLKEREGILLWMVEGLHRLINQNFQFTLSSRTRDTMAQQIRDANNVVGFLESQGYVVFGKNRRATCQQLYEVYQQWCRDNLEHSLSYKSFNGSLSQLSSRYGLKYNKNIPLQGDRRSRGYDGIAVKQPQIVGADWMD